MAPVPEVECSEFGRRLRFPVQCWLLMSLLPGPWMMNSHGHHSKRDAESIEDIPAESIEDIP